MYIKFTEKEANISLEVSMDGFSKEIKYDILHYLQDALDRETGLQLKKLKNLSVSFNEGYNQLSNETEGLHDPGSEYKEAYKETTEELESQNPIKKEKPPKEFGVKLIDGEKRYQCFYICTESYCRNKGKRYIRKGDKYTFCHECNRRLDVDPATENGFPEQDEYNNYFIAGAFERDFKPAYQYSTTN